MNDDKETLKLRIKCLELEVEILKFKLGKQAHLFDRYPLTWKEYVSPVAPNTAPNYYPNPYTVTCRSS